MSEPRIEQQTMTTDSGTGSDTGTGSNGSKTGLDAQEKESAEMDESVLEQVPLATGDTGKKKEPKVGLGPEGKPVAAESSGEQREEVSLDGEDTGTKKKPKVAGLGV